MRAIQRAIVGVGLAVVATVAMALLIVGPGSIGPDPSSQPAQRATGQGTPLADGPTGPPEPIDAAEDTSVGTLPPPPDASVATQLASRDLLAPSDSPPVAGPPAEGNTLSARKARAGKKPNETSGEVPPVPEQGFTAPQDGWGWSEWADAEDRHGDRDSDDCRKHHSEHRSEHRNEHRSEHRSELRYDRRDGCDDDDRRD